MKKILTASTASFFALSIVSCTTTNTSAIENTEDLVIN